MVTTLKVSDKYSAISGIQAEEFRDELTAIQEDFDDDLLIDLAGIDNLSSIGISAILLMHSYLQKHGRKLSVTNINEKNYQIFEMLNMTDILG